MDSPITPLMITAIDSLFYQKNALKNRYTDIMEQLRTMQRESEYILQQTKHIQRTVGEYPDLFKGVQFTLDRLNVTERSVDDLRKTFTNHTMGGFEPR